MRKLWPAPLREASASELLDALLGADPSIRPLTSLLIERTEGNPFFLEESVRTLVETGRLAGQDIPEPGMIVALSGGAERAKCATPNSRWYLIGRSIG